MATTPRLTVKRREVLEQMRQGWQMVVQMPKYTSPRAFLVRRTEHGVCEERRVNFSIVDGLQQARLIDVVQSTDNGTNWEYRLVEGNNGSGI